jgi:hypothetical protein
MERLPSLHLSSDYSDNPPSRARWQPDGESYSVVWVILVGRETVCLDRLSRRSSFLKRRDCSVLNADGLAENAPEVR